MVWLIPTYTSERAPYYDLEVEVGNKTKVFYVSEDSYNKYNEGDKILVMVKASNLVYVE